MPTLSITTSFISRDETFEELMNALQEISSLAELDIRKYTLKDTHLSSRVVSHWAKHGLLPDGLKDKDGWSKFSRSELVWLKVATRLREFGFSLTKIEKVKKQIMVFNPSNQMYPLFNYYVAMALYRDDDIYVVALSNAAADIGSFLEIELSKDEMKDKNKDMLLISLKQILKEIGMKTPKASSLIPFSVFSNDPRVMKMLHGIRSGNVQEARITTKDKHVNKIEMKRNYQNPERSLDKIRELLKDGRRKRISLEAQDGNIIAIEEIEKT